MEQTFVTEEDFALLESKFDKLQEILFDLIDDLVAQGNLNEEVQSSLINLMNKF